MAAFGWKYFLDDGKQRGFPFTLPVFLVASRPQSFTPQLLGGRSSEIDS
jgi:hypothetical protein